MSESWFTAFRCQRIHQVLKYFFLLLDYLHSRPHTIFVVWSCVASKPAPGISQVLILLNKGAPFHHISHIPSPSRYLKAMIKLHLNIFKYGSRLSLCRLLPQSLVSGANVILFTVPPRRVLLMLFTKLIQSCSSAWYSPASIYKDCICCFIYSVTQGLYSVSCAQSLLSPWHSRCFAEDICLLFIFDTRFSLLDIWLCIWLRCLNKPFLSNNLSQAAQLTHYHH